MTQSTQYVHLKAEWPYSACYWELFSGNLRKPFNNIRRLVDEGCGSCTVKRPVQVDGSTDLLNRIELRVPCTMATDMENRLMALMLPNLIVKQNILSEEQTMALVEAFERPNLHTKKKVKTQENEDATAPAEDEICPVCNKNKADKNFTMKSKKMCGSCYTAFFTCDAFTGN